MYEIKSLEDEWRAYRRRKRRPFWIFLLLLLVVGGVFSYVDREKLSMQRITTWLNEIKLFGDSASHVNPEEIAKSMVKHEGLSNALDERVNEGEVLVDVPILDMENETIAQKPTSQEDRPQIDIIGTSSAIAYEEVERRFEQTKDVDDALFLAKSYYKKGEYEKAAYWALETNKLDDDIEESVFIFVESKVKLGQINEGISILKRYIEQSESEDAQELLIKLESE
jgi:tetratricopeptide (TPR) repeat protein